jgi:hypothetical protein
MWAVRLVHVLFIVVRRPNTIIHDTQQDANSENKYTTVNVVYELSHIANTLENYDSVGFAKN